ncbi:hypothetical protein DENSPDRAFT_873774 [Dentipellis sp. KUC8613]|nr:hypothetical protein DENSPDRAFT_873774 [Dentipellis sp. KUC8613]
MPCPRPIAVLRDQRKQMDGGSAVANVSTRWRRDPAKNGRSWADSRLSLMAPVRIGRHVEWTGGSRRQGRKQGLRCLTGGKGGGYMTIGLGGGKSGRSARGARDTIWGKEKDNRVGEVIGTGTIPREYSTGWPGPVLCLLMEGQDNNKAAGG